MFGFRTRKEQKQLSQQEAARADFDKFLPILADVGDLSDADAARFEAACGTLNISLDKVEELAADVGAYRRAAALAKEVTDRSAAATAAGDKLNAYEAQTAALIEDLKAKRAAPLLALKSELDTARSRSAEAWDAKGKLREIFKRRGAVHGITDPSKTEEVTEDKTVTA